MLFFFFKQKTAYEMRISDWSSDVCSSDLIASLKAHRAFERRNQIAVVVFMRQRVALVGEMPRIATMLGSVFRCDDAAIIDQFVEGDGLDGYRLLAIFHCPLPLMPSISNR